MVEDPPADTDDTGLIPDLGRSHMAQKYLVCVLQLMRLSSRAWESQRLSPHALTTEARAP